MTWQANILFVFLFDIRGNTQETAISLQSQTVTFTSTAVTAVLVDCPKFQNSSLG